MIKITIEWRASKETVKITIFDTTDRTSKSIIVRAWMFHKVLSNLFAEDYQSFTIPDSETLDIAERRNDID